MNWPDALSIGKDIILSVSAITGASVAVIGLNTWRRQLAGQSEYDLARRILVGLYKYRDAIAGVRNPFIPVSEMPAPPEDEARNMTYSQTHFFGLAKAYEKRWDAVLSERSTLYADMLEAEAIWGSEPKVLFNDMYELQSKLFLALKRYLATINPDTDKAFALRLQNDCKKIDGLIYDGYGDM